MKSTIEKRSKTGHEIDGERKTKTAENLEKHKIKYRVLLYQIIVPL